MLGQTANLTFLKHKTKHHYFIKIGREHKAMETFILANVEAVGMRMEDFDLPSDLHKLIEVTKDRISTQKDLRIAKMFKTIHQSSEVVTLQNVLIYLSSHKYDADVSILKGLIRKYSPPR